MFDESLSVVGNACLIVAVGIDDDFAHTLIASGCDRGSAVGERFFHEGDDVGLGFVLRARRVLFGRRFFAARRD